MLLNQESKECWESLATLQFERDRAACQAEQDRREALGPDGRRHEDYGKLWAEMQQGRR